jgi:hypothetical protein
MLIITPAFAMHLVQKEIPDLGSECCSQGLATFHRSHTMHARVAVVVQGDEDDGCSTAHCHNVVLDYCTPLFENPGQL